MKKELLILCTGNSCRSIIAEALVNAKLSDCVHAQSSGVSASGRVNHNAKMVLQNRGYWRDEYHSKTIDAILDYHFDLIITVCDNAKESCPLFPKPIKTIHVGFEDPDGKPISAFYETLELIEKELLPVIEAHLCSEKS